MRALWMLIETVGSLLVTACLLRAWAQWVQVHPRNPLLQFLIAVTDWIVKPLRRVVPGMRGVDWASIVAGLLISLSLATGFVLLTGSALEATQRAPGAGAVLVLALVWMVRWSLYALMGLLILQVIMSWVNPNAPMAPAVDQLVRPFLAPFRRFIPLVGNFDLTPMVLFLLIQFALMALEPLAFAGF